MPSNEYQFVSRWRVRGTCGEVADVLGDPLALVDWWPSVYLEVEQVAPARRDGTGGRARLLTKGWLPYTLQWQFEVVESRYPHGFTLVASGDFDGRGVWTFTQDGPFVDIVYDWRISAEKPLLRNLSVVLKPVFAANHRWAMAQGEASLELERARRRAVSDEARRQIPPPPGPVTYAGVAVLGGVILSAAAVAYLVRRATRPHGPGEKRRRRSVS
jgi:hypothetical protein